MSPHRNNGDSPFEKATALHIARVSGSATTTVVELLCFHPFDTIVKRLMNHSERIESGLSISTKMERYQRIALKEAYTEPSILRRYFSLFTGLTFALGYKVPQRVVLFGGQSFVYDKIETKYGAFISSLFDGNQHLTKTFTHATAGAIIGVFKIILLPLDVLKIKKQNNPATLKGRGLLGVLRTERFTDLYRGAVWTAARNAPGSFALFGTNAMVKSRIFGLTNFSDATLKQNFLASAAGGVACLTVASPFDVIKTRIQTRDFSSGVSGGAILRNLLRSEGPTALFKGLVPKIFIVGPKLVFSFTVAQHLIGVFERRLVYT